MIVGSLIDYQKKAHETAIYPPDQALHYLIPGLLVEVLELDHKINDPFGYPREDILAEVGDVLWFCAEILTYLDYPLTTDPTLNPTPRMMKPAIDLCDEWVKLVRDRHGKPQVLFRAGAIASVQFMVLAVMETCDRYRTPILDVANMNLAKLADRQQRNALSGSGDKR